MGFQVTARDTEMLAWIGRNRLATGDQVARRFGLQRTKAYARLRGLKAAGLVRHESPVRGAGVFLATRAGLALADVELAPATVSLAMLEHDLAVVDVSILLESRMGATVLTDRELRRDAAVADRSGVPDLVLLPDDRRRLAVEVELSRKSRARVSEKLRWYTQSRDYTAVVYFVRDDRDAARINELAAEAGVDRSRLVVRLLPDATNSAAPAATPAPLLEQEVASFVAGDSEHREKILAQWQARYAAQEAI